MTTELTINRSHLQQFLESDAVSAQIEKVAPANFNMDGCKRFAATALQKGGWAGDRLRAAYNTPEGRISLGNSLITLASFGLMPDGRHAHLIPFKNEITAMVDYKGWIHLLYRNGATDVCGAVVYQDEDGAGDQFSYQKSPVEELLHRPAFPRKGKPIAVWTRVVTGDGTTHLHVMDVNDVDHKRSRSRDFGRADNPNQTDPDDMRLRTCLKNHIKWLPTAPEFNQILELDNDLEDAKRDREAKAYEKKEHEALPKVGGKLFEKAPESDSEAIEAEEVSSPSEEQEAALEEAQEAKPARKPRGPLGDNDDAIDVTPVDPTPENQHLHLIAQVRHLIEESDFTEEQFLDYASDVCDDVPPRLEGLEHLEAGTLRKIGAADLLEAMASQQSREKEDLDNQAQAKKLEELISHHGDRPIIHHLADKDIRSSGRHRGIDWVVCYSNQYSRPFTAYTALEGCPEPFPAVQGGTRIRTFSTAAKATEAAKATIEVQGNSQITDPEDGPAAPVRSPEEEKATLQRPSSSSSTDSLFPAE